MDKLIVWLETLGQFVYSRLGLSLHVLTLDDKGYLRCCVCLTLHLRLVLGFPPHLGHLLFHLLDHVLECVHVIDEVGFVVVQLCVRYHGFFILLLHLRERLLPGTHTDVYTLNPGWELP